MGAASKHFIICNLVSTKIKGVPEGICRNCSLCSQIGKTKQLNLQVDFLRIPQKG